MKSKYDTRELRREMAKLLGKSEAWVVIRVDEQGTHIHTPEEEQLSLIAVVLKNNPELLEITNELINNPLTEFNESLN
jgi:hypothetical protein